MSAEPSAALPIIAIFGPTGVGKTAVAVALAEVLRERGEDPVAISCDAIQIYRGLELISGAASTEQQAVLEHRMLAIADVGEEFSAGRFAEQARAEIDGLLAVGRRPIVVGGTGLYMRATLTELALQPPVDPAVRTAVEEELEQRGTEAVHAQLDPEVAARVHPNDRKRIGRALELQRSGLDPPERGGELWTARLRLPTRLYGLLGERGWLTERISARVDAMVAAGAAEEVARARAAGASRTARAALGFEQLLAGDIEGTKTAHRRYARRQETWMRKMPGLELLAADQSDPQALAARIAADLGELAGP